MSRKAFQPDLHTTAAKGGHHEMESSPLRGKFTSKKGSTTYYYLGPIVPLLPTHVSPVFTPDDFNALFKVAFPTYKNTDRKASDMYLAYLQSWGYIQLESAKDGDRERTYRVILDNDITRFKSNGIAENSSNLASRVSAKDADLSDLRDVRHLLSSALKMIDQLIERSA